MDRDGLASRQVAEAADWDEQRARFATLAPTLSELGTRRDGPFLAGVHALRRGRGAEGCDGRVDGRCPFPFLPVRCRSLARVPYFSSRAGQVEDGGERRD